MSNINDLSREERVALAAIVYGLKGLPRALQEAKERTSSRELEAIDAAMGARGVPHYETLLHEREKKVLESHRAEQRRLAEIRGATNKIELQKAFDAAFPIDKGREATLSMIVNRNDSTWAVGLDDDGEIVMIRAYETSTQKIGYATDAVYRVESGETIQRAVDRFLGAYWLYEDTLATRVTLHLTKLKESFVSRPTIYYALPEVA